MPDARAGERAFELLRTVAALKLDDEVEGGIENDQAWSDREGLILEARKIVGDPGYPKLED